MKRYLILSAVLIITFSSFFIFKHSKIIITEEMIDYESLYILGIEKTIKDNYYFPDKPNFILLSVEQLKMVNEKEAMNVLEELSERFEIPFYNAYESDMDDLGLGENLYEVGGGWIIIDRFYLDESINGVVLNIGIGNAGDGAAGYKSLFEYKKGQWQIDRFDATWIS